MDDLSSAVEILDKGNSTTDTRQEHIVAKTHPRALSTATKNNKRTKDDQFSAILIPSRRLHSPENNHQERGWPKTTPPPNAHTPRWHTSSGSHMPSSWSTSLSSPAARPPSLYFTSAAPHALRILSVSAPKARSNPAL